MLWNVQYSSTWRGVILLFLICVLSEDFENFSRALRSKHIQLSGNERVLVHWGGEREYHRKLLLIALRRRSLNENEEDKLYSTVRKEEFDPLSITTVVNRDTTNRPLDSSLFRSLPVMEPRRRNTTSLEFKRFQSEACVDLDREKSSCRGLESKRNSIMRYCAADSSESCCAFLQRTRQDDEWSSFRSCFCTRRLVCDLEPFLDLDSTFTMCGIPLQAVPIC